MLLKLDIEESPLNLHFPSLFSAAHHRVILIAPLTAWEFSASLPCFSHHVVQALPKCTTSRQEGMPPDWRVSPRNGGGGKE